MDETRLAEAIIEAFNRAAESKAATDATSAQKSAEDESRRRATKELLEFTKSLKDNSTTFKNLERIVKNQPSTYQSIEEQLKKFDDQLAKSSSVDETRDLKKQKQDLETTKKMQDLSGAITDASIGFVKLSVNLGTLVAGATGDFVRGLQRGSSGVELSAGLMTAGVDAANTAAQAAAGGLTVLGTIAATNANKNFKVLGLGLLAAGTGLGFLGNSASKVAKFGIEFLAAELTKTSQAFNSASSAGALFSSGMTGLRDAATSAGLRVDQLASVISRQSINLAATGLSVGEAVKQVGRVGAVLKTQEIDKKLLRLGFGVEEQAELVAEVLSDMRRANAAGMMDPMLVAKRTEEYAENLRVIAALTGEDARRKMEESRRITADTAFRIKLMEKEKQLPGTFDAMNQVLTLMPQSMQTAIKQIITFGAVSDTTAAQQMATVENFANIVNRTAAMFNNNTFSVSAIQKVLGEESDKSRERVQRLGVASTEYAVGVAAQNKKLTELGAAQDSFTRFTDRMSTEGQEAARKAAAAQAQTNDKLTNSFVDAQVEAQNFALKLQEKILPLMTEFSVVTDRLLKEVDKAIGDFTKDIKEGRAGLNKDQNMKPEESFFDILKRYGSAAALEGAKAGVQTAAVAYPVATAAAAGTLGTGAPVSYTAATVATVIATVGGAITGALNEWFNKKEGKARGGIIRGSSPGAPVVEKVHDSEAVVPLPDGKTIPVKLDAQFKPVVQRTEPIGTKVDNKSAGFSFLGTMSRIVDNLSKVGSSLKDTFTINQTELAAAFEKNKLDPKEIKDLINLKTPVKDEPGIFETLFSTVTNALKDLDRSFSQVDLRRADENKVQQSLNLVNDRLNRAIGTQPIEEPMKPISSTQEVKLDDKSVNELKEVIKSPTSTLNNIVADLVMSRMNISTAEIENRKLLDSLKEYKSDGNIEQQIENLTQEIKKTSIGASKIEISNIDSLKQLSVNSIVEALSTRPVDVGAENCSSLIAKYISENKANFEFSITENFESIFDRLARTIELNKEDKKTTVDSESIKEIKDFGSTISKSLINLDISSVFGDFKAELTNTLNDFINQLNDSVAASQEMQKAEPNEPIQMSDELVAAIKDALINGNGAIKEELSAQSEILRAHLEKIDQLVSISSDTNGINKQMLNQIY